MSKAAQGISQVPGFMQFDKESEPKDFHLLLYSLDATLPVINLHSYDKFFPEQVWFRILTAIHHVFGWILLTVFLASVAIL